MQADETNTVRTQAGFTLIELLIALTVTMIITGAMYGLLAGGQNAFRREPELTDRQQAIRLGMDRIQRDVLAAGERLGIDSQIFTRNLNATGVAGPNGVNTDKLELISAPPTCPDLWVNRQNLPNTNGTGVNGQGNSVLVFVLRPPPPCVRVPGIVLIVHDNGATKPAKATQVPSSDRIQFALGQQDPPSAVDSADDFQCGQAQMITPTTPCTAPGNPPEKMLYASLVRYVIWPDQDGIPSLWRSDTGGAGLNPPDPAGDWRLVARGVEDLQVQYRTDPANINAWNDDPGQVTAGAPNTVVREVRVVLGARTVATNLQGTRTGATSNAVRGQLLATIAPRTALFNLGRIDAWH